MKTILITSFHSSTSRDILSTDIIPLLLRTHDIKIVIACPLHKKSYFEDTFGGERVSIEGIPTGAGAEMRSRLFFKRLSRVLLESGTIRIKARAKLYAGGSYFRYMISRILMALGHLRLLRALVRFADYCLRDRRRCRALFEKWHPDFVFSTDIQLADDTAVMHEAKARGIPFISKVRSWDNLTQWGIIRVIPSRLFVPTEIVKKEAVEYHHIPEKNIEVVGIPHFDRYFTWHPTKARIEFIRGIGLDPAKKLILFAPVTDFRIAPNDLDRFLLEIFARMPRNIVVRIPPQNPVSIGDFVSPPHMRFDCPGVLHREENTLDKDISPEEDEYYRNLLWWADVIVCATSTVAIDAAIFDRPVVLVGFTPTPRNFFEGVIEFAFDHILPVLASGGVHVAKSPEEMCEWIEKYIAHPEIDYEGRRRLVETECFSSDGKASERVAVRILKHLGDI